METIKNKFGIRLIGDSREAEAWIQSSGLNDNCKASFLNLVRRFPTMQYQRWEEIHSDFGPDWLRSFRMVLDGINADGTVWMSFDREDPFYDTHELPKEDIWYQRFLDYSPTSEYDVVYCGEDRLIFLAHWQEEDYFLAVKDNDDNDQCVFALHADHISQDSSMPNNGDLTGRIEMNLIETAFDSYADMYGHIAALKIGDTIISSE